MKLLRQQQGQSTIEYVLVVGAVGVVIAGILMVGFWRPCAPIRRVNVFLRGHRQRSRQLPGVTMTDKGNPIP